MIDRLAQALALRDLTDPSAGEHAVPRVVSVTDNYDRLRYDRDAVTRDQRYSRYVGPDRMLRSHTTARIPALLDRLAAGGLDDAGPDDVVLSVPGICYRRDVIDSGHVGEPHQLDLWRIRRGGPALGEEDLAAMLAIVLGAVLPGRVACRSGRQSALVTQPWHTPPSWHPYTTAGREIYVAGVEVGECGLAHPEVLPAGTTGLAMGLGLDRLTMLVKGIADIRLLRAGDPQVAEQMRDLRPYRPVSAMPPVPRDLSLAVAADLDAELLGDRVRELLGPDADVVEEVAVLAETPYADLPDSARRRMGLRPGQKNVLVRVVLRALTRTLTAAAANELRDRIYAGLHEGARHEWGTPPG